MTSPRIWILGAPDPAMGAIDGLLSDSGESIAYAAIGGPRVPPAGAYAADGIAPAERGPAGRDPVGSGSVFLVECGDPARGIAGGYLP